jgi:hypothetical protein
MHVSESPVKVSRLVNDRLLVEIEAVACVGD